MPHQCLKCGQLFPEGSTTILRGCPECRGTKFFFTQEPLPAAERERLLRNSEVSLREAVEMLLRQNKEGVLTPEGVEWAKVKAGQTSPSASPTAAAPPQPSSPPSLVDEIAPVPQRPRGESKLMAGNRLLIKLPKAGKRYLARQDVRWDYVPPPPAPEPTPPATPRRVLYVASPPPGPAEVEDVGPPVAAPQPAIESFGLAPPPVPATTPSEVELIISSAIIPEGDSAPAPEPSAPPTIVTLTPAPPPSPDVAALGEAQPETIRIKTPGRYEIDVKRLLEDSPIVIQRDGTYLIHLPSLFESANKSKK